MRVSILHRMLVSRMVLVLVLMLVLMMVRVVLILLWIMMLATWAEQSLLLMLLLALRLLVPRKCSGSRVSTMNRRRMPYRRGALLRRSVAVLTRAYRRVVVMI